MTRVLFIGGLGRSGSTLLELILAQSPDVVALGEVVHLWERALRDDQVCGCGVRFSVCPFWEQVGKQAFGGWSTVDVDEVLALKGQVDRTRHIPRLARTHLPEPYVSAVRRYADLYGRIYQAAQDVSGAEVAVDSSKHASLALALRWGDLDLRVLHLIRDSRAVAHSWAKQIRRPEVVDTEEYMPVFSPTRVSALWTVQNGAFDLLARRTPVKRLRYEDFTANPRAVVTDVRALAGLAPREDALQVFDDASAVLEPAHTVAGNPLRFNPGPLRVRADEEWRTKFPRRNRATVGTLTLPLRWRYGYRGPRTREPAPPEESE